MTISATFGNLTSLNGLTQIPQGGITVATSATSPPLSTSGEIYYLWSWWFTKAS